MAKVLAKSERIAWQKKIVGSDPSNSQAVYASDIELHGSSVYIAFMYVGDCLIIVLDTSGNEMMKKKFGVEGEKDIVIGLAFT